MLRIASDHLGNVAVICDWCERKRAGICRDCPSPLVPDTLGRNNSPRCLECAVRQRIESSRRFARIQYREHRKKWTDVARMRTLNGNQEAKGREMHLCPMQFDIADRLITRYSNPGDEVYDPFAGLFTVPLRAIALGRRGVGTELGGNYFADGVRYLRAAEEKAATPTLFDLVGEDAA